MKINPPLADSFLANKSVLLTGATGFVGKATLELILRDHYPKINYIFLLMRASKRKSIEERYNEIFSNKLFSTLEDSMGFQEYWKMLKSKVIPINGDILASRLGISEPDLVLLKRNANYVIHCAAAVDFNSGLYNSFELNVIGVQKMMDLCDELDSCLGFEYVSTAYTNSNLSSGEVLERVYPIEIEDPKVLIDLIPKLNESESETLSQKILKKYPNMYTFTKSLSEHNVLNWVEFMKNREIDGGKASWPVCIIRPTIVTNTAYYPLPGWSDGLNGHNGVVLYASLGLFDTIAGTSNNYVDLVPVDFLAHTMIKAIAALTSPGVKYSLPYFNDNNCDEYYNIYPKIYHASSSSVNPLTLGDIDYYLHKGIDRLPPMKRQIFRHRHIKYKNDYINKLAFMLRTEARFLFLFAKVILIDREKLPKIKLLKTKLHYLCDCFRYFWNNGWVFKQDNIILLESKISSGDLAGRVVSNQFTIDNIRNILLEPYIYNTVYGVFYYVLKESPSIRNMYSLCGWECSLGKSNRLAYIKPNIALNIQQNNAKIDKEPIKKIDPSEELSTEFQNSNPCRNGIYKVVSNTKFQSLLSKRISNLLVNKTKISQVSSALSKQYSKSSVIYISNQLSSLDPLILCHTAKKYSLPIPQLYIENNRKIFDYSLIDDSTLLKFTPMTKFRVFHVYDDSKTEKYIIRSLKCGHSICLFSKSISASDGTENKLTKFISKLRKINDICPVYIVPFSINYEYILDQQFSTLEDNEAGLFDLSQKIILKNCEKIGDSYFNINDPILVSDAKSETKISLLENIMDQIEINIQKSLVITSINIFSTILLQNKSYDKNLKLSQCRILMRSLKENLENLGYLVDINDDEDMNAVLHHSIEVIGADYIKLTELEADQLITIENWEKLENLLSLYSKPILSIINKI